MTLMARDLGGPAIAAQILICPMLDHRNVTISSRQYSGEPGVWTREMNAFGWRSVIGDSAGDQLFPVRECVGRRDLGGRADLGKAFERCHRPASLFNRNRAQARPQFAWRHCRLRHVRCHSSNEVAEEVSIVCEASIATDYRADNVSATTITRHPRQENFLILFK
jgi:hypothetical protein